MELKTTSLTNEEEDVIWQQKMRYVLYSEEKLGNPVDEQLRQLVHQDLKKWTEILSFASNRRAIFEWCENYEFECFEETDSDNESDTHRFADSKLNDKFIKDFQMALPMFFQEHLLQQREKLLHDLANIDILLNKIKNMTVS